MFFSSTQIFCQIQTAANTADGRTVPDIADFLDSLKAAADAAAGADAPGPDLAAFLGSLKSKLDKVHDFTFCL